ncbi:MAG: ATP synthase subunit I [Polaromonas sp.]|nr:ATP synthase subunit I [Polaromonas sp.]
MRQNAVSDNEQNPNPKAGASRTKNADRWSDADARGAWSDGFQPLTRTQAQTLRRASPPLSPWWVVAGQLLTGILVALLAWGVTGRQNVGWSAFYGGLTVVIPAALMARGLASRLLSIHPGAAVAGFFLWEMVKVATTVGMLFAAPRLIVDLDWLAMLIGLMVTLQVYVVALLVRPGPKSKSKSKTD